ncbi:MULTISPECIES: DUF1120 domain-containing protein [Pseudomonas]|jgi:hypothetical protein|uniref:DUF1120 domain-containing protein n=3 Tax=Gammaproteobacteria TaxID=1236 RepID=A0A0R3BCQ0_PSEVE|nr:MULTISPECIES: DUF1120 domain-containing protein [Pseudomonas]SEB94148.1 Protein of unknown function [Pseudomonas marginalis]AQY64497.1 hypothetical protein PverR02_05350 [Pseudomonas veronii]KRP80475.1 hypothetical protein TU80_08995 [Pseudomonas veronii]MBI6553115.1 DUF1120 domain-containing protein [Pseudomonas veronii]MBI6650542.1 DUF1120 domain-containing protein [Pseudomonas veronii]
MKKPLAAFTAVIALVGSGMTFAASTVELTVKGVITPSACTPTLSASGVVDHGKVSVKDLNLDSPTSLPTARLQLNVDCEAATLFALRTTDNRAGSSIYGFGYGLGLINNLQKIGTFWLSLRNPVADNVAVEPIESLDGVSWQAIDDVVWQNPYMAAFGDRSNGQDPKPIPIKNVISELVIDTQIAAANSLDLSNEVLIDGSATIEVKYL